MMRVKVVKVEEAYALFYPAGAVAGTPPRRLRHRRVILELPQSFEDERDPRRGSVAVQIACAEGGELFNDIKDFKLGDTVAMELLEHRPAEVGAPA